MTVTSRIRRRTAFTLIELLVVVSIITVMMSLLMAGVQRARDAGSRTLAHSEIRELAQGVALFKNKFNVDYIPSQIVLREDMSTYGNTQIEIDSLTWLRTAWPNLTFPIDWNQSGKVETTPIVLEGDQCLVFFLGGISDNGQPGGFSTNPRNPMDTSNPNGKRVGPFAQFQTIRLTLNGNAASKLGFRSYIDPWKKIPYAYFASYGKQRGFNPYVALGGNPDCPTLGAAMYVDPSTNKALSNADGFGFQIISAGKDAAFGSGGANLPATGTGEDDIANFSRATLGSGIQ